MGIPALYHRPLERSSGCAEAFFIPAEEASFGNVWARSGQEQVFEAEKREEAAYGELEGLLEETSYQFPLCGLAAGETAFTGLLVAEGYGIRNSVPEY